MQTKKYPSGNWGTQSNQKHSPDSLDQRRARLGKTLKESFNAGLIPASWVAEIARVGGFHV